MHAEQTRKSVIEANLNRDKEQADARGLGCNKPEVALRKLTGHKQDAKK